jgi:two-component system, NarL family, sensor histidine kinase UhpB
MQDMQRPAPRLWRDPSVRARLLLTFLSLNMLAGILACGVMIWNARQATRVEMQASIEIAERFVKETLIRFGPSTSGGAMLTNLPLHLNLVRHVRMAILDNSGDLKVLLPENEEDDDDEEAREHAPLWFARLLSIHIESRHVPVVAEGRRVGTVVIMGEPGDEAAEVWQDIRALAIMTPCINALIFLLFYISLGRILNPLVSFSDGLKHLEHGDYRSRLPRPGIREMAAVADRINALAAVLEEARQENSRLYRALISIQEEERKQIAADLHNEFGQCLFGIKANASSIAALTGGLDAGKAEAVAERVRSIASITERLQSMNRRLLRKLRPSAFGHVSLGELLEDLVMDFRRHHDGIVFEMRTGPLQRSYGEAIDLSIYRCVQEGLTNSVRHASARTVGILVEDGGPAASLRIEIRDDGQGFSAADLTGFGLRSMRERVRSLGGECVIEGAKPEGTQLTITFPHSTPAFAEEVA